MKNKIAAFTFLLFAVATARLAVDPSATDPFLGRSDDAFKLIKTSPESVIADDSNILITGEKAKSDSDDTAADSNIPVDEKSKLDSDETTADSNILTGEKAKSDSDETAADSNILPDEKAKSDSDKTAADSNILLLGEKAKSDSHDTTADNRLPEPEKTTNDLTPHTDLVRFHTINRHFRGQPRVSNQIGTHRRPCLKHVTPYRTETNDVVSSSKTGTSDPEAFRVQIPSDWLTLKHHYGSRRHHNHRRDDGVTTERVFDKEKVKSLIRQHKQKKREEDFGFMKNIRKFLKHTFD